MHGSYQGVKKGVVFLRFTDKFQACGQTKKGIFVSLSNQSLLPNGNYEMSHLKEAEKMNKSNVCCLFLTEISNK